MKILILPGFSLRNKDWAEEVASYLGKDAIVHNWLHWQTGKNSLSLRNEIEKILEEVGKEKVNIIAKSVGTMVCMNLLLKIPSQIEKIILCGIPTVSEERLNLFKEALKDFPSSRIIVFQNTEDPFAGYLEVKSFMNKVDPEIKVVEKERSDHNYPYFEEFNKFLG